VVLYLTVAIGGNVLLRRSQRIRAWAAERAVRIGAKSSRGPSPTSVADRDLAPRHPTAPKPVISHYEIRTPLLVIADLIAAVISVFVAIAVALPQPDGGSRLSFLPIIVVFGAVDLFLAHLTRKQVRLARRTRRGTI